MCLAPAASMVEAAAGVLCPGHHHSPDDGDGQRQQPHCWPGRKRQPCCPRPRPRVDGGDDDAVRGGGGSKVRRQAGSSAAVPVAIAIPVAAVKRRASSSLSSWAEEDDYGGDDDDDEAALFVPPHEAVEARWGLSEGKAAASMCEGRGRTLKGRDLLSVRDAVLRMTGFIET